MEYYEKEALYISRAADLNTHLLTLKEFERSNKEYIKYLWKSENIFSQEEWGSDIVNEVDHLEEEYEELLESVNSCRTTLKVAKDSFQEEANKPINSKTYGQPVRAGIEDILQSNGIDMGAYLGGDI